MRITVTINVLLMAAISCVALGLLFTLPELTGKQPEGRIWVGGLFCGIGVGFWAAYLLENKP